MVQNRIWAIAHMCLPVPLGVNCMCRHLQMHVCSPVSFNHSCLCSCGLRTLVMLSLVKPPMTLSSLSIASCRTCCFPNITPLPHTELAMMSARSTNPAEECHTEWQKQVGAVLPLLACMPLISREGDQSLSFCCSVL